MLDPIKTRDNYASDIPIVGDPAWPFLVKPLYDWLATKQRTIDEIVAWGREGGDAGYQIRSRLAWLCVKDMVRYVDGKDGQEGTWRIVPGNSFDEAR